MDFFSETSVENYVKIENVNVKDKITIFSACFWAKFLKTFSSIFVYSSASQNTEIGVCLYENYVLGLIIEGKWDDKRLVMGYFGWHTYPIL